jgi:hypothetical protein
MLASRLTSVPGASAFFERGCVTYSNASKADLLGVDPRLIESRGAVSEEVARAMAEGARRSAGADLPSPSPASRARRRHAREAGGWCSSRWRAPPAIACAASSSSATATASAARPASSRAGDGAAGLLGLSAP